MTSEPGVIFEFFPLGNSIRVCAFDTKTLTEIFIITPATTSKADMERLALQKLHYVLAKQEMQEDVTEEIQPRQTQDDNDLLV